MKRTPRGNGHDDDRADAVRNPESPGAGRIDRRRALKTLGAGALVAGLSEPVILRSFEAPAWAAGTELLSLTASTQTPRQVTISKGREVDYVVSGAGGGGGGGHTSTHTGGKGGDGLQLSGLLEAKPSSWTLYATVGAGGVGGKGTNNDHTGGAGGQSAVGSGGAGGIGRYYDGGHSGGGGGGGGASAVSSSPDFYSDASDAIVLVHAAGGAAGTTHGGNGAAGSIHITLA